MDRKRFCILVIAIIGLLQITFAQTKVKIGDLYYHLSGVTASVAENSQSTWARSEYRNSKYAVPDSIFYNGLTYIVKSLDDYAFSASNYYYTGSTASQITLPNTLESIGRSAFRDCKNLVNIVIPSSVKSFGNDSYDGTFLGCDLLRTIIYLPINAPQHWTATTNTYVPDKQSYSSPTFRINDANVIEMISFANNEFTYTGQAPTTTWTNNVEGYSASLTIPTLKTDAGSYKEEIPVTFTKDGESFTTNVVYRYTIKPAALTAKVTDATREYGEDNPQFDVTYSGLVSGDDENTVFSIKPTVSTTAVKTSNVGPYPITISGGVAKNYQLEYEPGVLTVNKAPLTIKINDTTKVYGTQNPAFTVSYTGLKNNEKEPSWSSQLRFSTIATKNSDVGNYDINATGNPANYELSSISKGILTIEQAPLTIKAKDTTRVYYEPDPVFEYTCTGLVNDDDESVITTQPSFTTNATQTSNVGTYSITPAGAISKNYRISYESGLLTIAKRELKVTSNCSREYGEDNPIFTISYDGFANNENADVISTKPTTSTYATKESIVGKYPITVSGGSATNYKIVCQNGVLTITKAPLSAKVNDATKVYGTKNPTFSLSYTGLKNGETSPLWQTPLHFNTEAVESSDAGIYDINATGNPANYELSPISKGVLTIEQAPLTIKAKDTTRVYYESDPVFEYTCTGLVNDDDESVITTQPSFTTDATLTSNVGTYSITPTGVTAKNYNIIYEPGVLTITKRLLEATSNCSREYGEDNPSFTITYYGFVNNENTDVISEKPTATTHATKTTNVGEYTINVSGGSSTNYDIICQNGLLTITKAPLTATVNDTTKIYGYKNPLFTLKYEGLKNDQASPDWLTNPTFQTSATQNSNIGQYDVNAIDGVARNYNVTFRKGIMTITKAKLTVLVNNQDRLYFEENPALTYSYKGFTANDDASAIVVQPQITTSASLKSKAGKYPIYATGAEADNYFFVYEPGTLEVKKRSLTVSLSNYKRAYNEDNPLFKVYYNGFVNNENEDVLNSKPVVSTSATKTSDVGLYTLRISGGEADNYDFVYKEGQLEIEKAYQALTWEQSLDDIPLYSQIELDAEASSGLPITYSVNTDTVCNISYIGDKTFLDCFHYGKAVVYAMQEGNNNYWPTTKRYKDISVSEVTSIKDITPDNLLAGKILIKDGHIIVKNVDNKVFIMIFNHSGTLVYKGNGECDVYVPSGVYIIRFGSSSTKVIVK